jgi:hypothetical protein
MTKLVLEWEAVQNTVLPYKKIQKRIKNHSWKVFGDHLLNTPGRGQMYGMIWLAGAHGPRDDIEIFISFCNSMSDPYQMSREKFGLFNLSLFLPYVEVYLAKLELLESYNMIVIPREIKEILENLQNFSKRKIEKELNRYYGILGPIRNNIEIYGEFLKEDLDILKKYLNGKGIDIDVDKYVILAQENHDHQRTE